jgi:hypothetical protein
MEFRAGTHISDEAPRLAGPHQTGSTYPAGTEIWIFSLIDRQLAESDLTGSLFQQMLQRIETARVAPDVIASPTE